MEVESWWLNDGRRERERDRNSFIVGGCYGDNDEDDEGVQSPHLLSKLSSLSSLVIFHVNII